MCIYPIPSPATTSMKQRYSLFYLIKSNVIIDTHVHNTQNVEIFILTLKKKVQLLVLFSNFFDN